MTASTAAQHPASIKVEYALSCPVPFCPVQVVRHERASIKADIWSYGILIWELITGEDITENQPLSLSRQVQ